MYPRGVLPKRSEPLELTIGQRIVLVSARLPVLSMPSQLVVFHGNLKKPISGFAVSERFRLLSRCFRTASPVIGLVEFTFRIHGNEHAIFRSTNYDKPLSTIT